MLRKHNRFVIDLEAEEGTLWIRDISFGGMRFLSDTALVINQVIECELETLRELESAFRFNDAVLRSLVIKRKHAVTTPSPLIKENEEKSAAPAPAMAEIDSGDSEAAEPAAPDQA